MQSNNESVEEPAVNHPEWAFVYFMIKMYTVCVSVATK